MKQTLLALLLCLFFTNIYAQNNILVVGDSISAGYGIDPGKGWVALLQRRLHDEKYDYQVINDSISGDTASDGLARLPNALKQVQPKITIIELGGNDGLRGLPAATIKNNLQQMIILTKQSRSLVLLLGVRMPPNYGITYTQQFQQIYTALQQQNNIALVPFFMKNVDDNPSLIQTDGIHPTQTAQIILLNNIWPTLENLLKTH